MSNPPVALTITSLKAFLPQALTGSLPRGAGQLPMAPHPRRGWKPDQLPGNARKAAALLLLYPKHGKVHTLLTVRSDQLPTHKGQISLPGGGVNSNEGIIDAALREGQEEVGIDPGKVEILGTLSPLHIPVSSFILHPVVASSDEQPDIRPCEKEVVRILEVPLAMLCDKKRIKTETVFKDGRTYIVPHFMLEGGKVWGATAMVLSEFLCLLGYPPMDRSQAQTSDR